MIRKDISSQNQIARLKQISATIIVVSHKCQKDTVRLAIDIPIITHKKRSVFFGTKEKKSANSCHRHISNATTKTSRAAYSIPFERLSFLVTMIPTLPI